jgi:hypothetical protein
VRTWGTPEDLSTRERLEGEVCGIPHLAKNERDVGHPAIGSGIELTGVHSKLLTDRDWWRG